MGFSSAPSRSLTAEDADSAEEFLFRDFGALELDAVPRTFARAISAAEMGFLPSFFSAPFALSAVKALRFLSARAMASASHGAFAFPRDAGRLLFHSAEPRSPPISAIV